jgi:hypothetical protein
MCLSYRLVWLSHVMDPGWTSPLPVGTSWLRLAFYFLSWFVKESDSSKQRRALLTQQPVPIVECGHAYM